MDPTYVKPIPEPSIDSQPWWDGLKSHRLLLQTCGNCGKIRHYPRPLCDACFSFEVEWTESTGNGTIHSWTCTYHPFHAGFRDETPYILVIVDLVEGVRIQSRLINADREALCIGLSVEVVFVDVTGDLTLPFIRLAG